MQGIELLTTGRITLPVPDADGACLRSIRRGEVPLGDVVAAIGDAEAELTRLRTDSAVPEHPDHGWVDQWLHRSHLAYWESIAEQRSEP